MPLPTAQQIRELAIKSLANANQDTKLDILIAAANKVFGRWCLYPPTGYGEDSSMERHTFIEFLDGPTAYNPRVIDTRVRPLASVDSVLQDALGDWSYTEELTLNVDFTFESMSSPRLVLIPSSTYTWRTGFRAIKVSGEMGWDVGANEALTLAIGLQVAYWWAMPGGMVPGVTSTAQGGSSVTVAPGAVPIKEARDILSMYRLIERQTH